MGWEAYLTEQRAHLAPDLIEFARIPSISSLPEHANDVQRAAEWVAARLEQARVEQVATMPTGGHPVVYGDWLHAPGKPTILIYGHFDVQPVDPIDEWTDPPFEPTTRDGRIYARGISDSKGSMFVVLAAVEAMLRGSGSLPVNAKFLFEGQEEIGSPQLRSFVAEHRDLLAADLVVNSDSLQQSDDQPALMIGLKGLAGLQIDVFGAASDLHSGVFGGAAPNPVQELVRILASMRDAAGRIAIDGFYDDVVPLSDQDRAQIAAFPFDAEEYQRELGAPGLAGEPGYTPLESLWARPTLEINGMWGGFQGEGVKTVIPREAHAKLSCRLVPNQEPEAIRQAIAAHVARVAPSHVRVDVQPLPGAARPYLIPADHWGNQAAAEVLRDLYGREPLFLRAGASVPVTGIFRDELEADTVSFGFIQPDENFHAPNEFFRLSSLERGPEAWCRLLERLGR